MAHLAVYWVEHGAVLPMAEQVATAAGRLDLDVLDGLDTLV